MRITRAKLDSIFTSPKRTLREFRSHSTKGLLDIILSNASAALGNNSWDTHKTCRNLGLSKQYYEGLTAGYCRGESYVPQYKRGKHAQAKFDLGKLDGAALRSSLESVGFPRGTTWNHLADHTTSDETGRSKL